MALTPNKKSKEEQPKKFDCEHLSYDWKMFTAMDEKQL